MISYAISTTLIALSFLTSLFIAVESVNSAYSFLFLLPLTYAICVFLSSRSVTMRQSVTCMAFVFGTFFIKRLLLIYHYIYTTHNFLFWLQKSFFKY